ncbi:hypothetical protein [Pseudomonas syringae group sp. J254-4]|uniref:hypothetical protein n=1 Tax=Pseudomonas syringae group sp. J254-4 TaxID=3079589 RepID=UPI00290BECFD|nr:hypothetical protein [Pseudomonas syringae group sp. J254-4]MDU8456768.1 hypothetical protein [Pseudomonas syringae group sp. J254-4]
MTKGELIEALAAFPDDSLVVVPGYESGFDDVCGAELRDVTYQPSRPDHDGYYQPAGKSQDEVILKVIHIARYIDE